MAADAGGGRGGAVVALLALLLWHPFRRRYTPGELEMTAIDVGQGDSLLVVFPDGKRMLVDGGGIPAFGADARSQLDIGEDVVAPYLWDRGIRRVDVVALSHAHEDHIGGLPALIADFPSAGVVDRRHAGEPGMGARCAIRPRQYGARIVPLHAPARFAFGGAEIEVLAPIAGLPAGRHAQEQRLAGAARALRPAPLPAERRRGAADRMARCWTPTSCTRTDVLKVAHHGSRTSSTEEFLERGASRVRRDLGGLREQLRASAPDGDGALAEHHAGVLRTDHDGLITIRTDGRRLRVETYRDVTQRRSVHKGGSGAGVNATTRLVHLSGCPRLITPAPAE